MRLVTYEPAVGCQRLGALVGGKVVDLALARDACEAATHTDILALPSDMMIFLELGNHAIKAAEQVVQWANDMLKKAGKVTTTSGETISYDLDKVRLRAPVPRPSKILCMAVNHPIHCAERKIPMSETPIIFMKPGLWPVVGPNDKLIPPPATKFFIFEGELGVVIGKRCHRVPKEKAYEVVAGYTCCNDMSARDLARARDVNKENHPIRPDWFRVKGFDTSLPMGPCLTLKDEIPDPHNLRLQLRVNGKTIQDAPTSEINFKIPDIIEFASNHVTLDPGDIISTGTYTGCNDPVNVGDLIEIEIENIGVLPNIVGKREG